MLAIETCGLSKAYKATLAVDNLEMHVEQGEIYGFIGRNGAGKSTTMKMLCSLAEPSSGVVRIFGHDPRDARAARIGALIEDAGLYPNMSAIDNLLCKAFSIGLPNAKAACNELLHLTGLGQTGKKKVRGFSLGMKQRLGLSLALVGSPEILLLDEPMNGLDPEGARDMRDFIVQLAQKKGITVLVSSHVLEQLGRMATRYGVINAGRMVREATAEEVDRECGDYLVLTVQEPEKVVAYLREKLPQHACSLIDDGCVRIEGNADQAEVAAVCAQQGITVEGLYRHRRDLEEYFIAMMGQEVSHA